MAVGTAGKASKIERIKTGIKGFDALIDEGIPRGSVLQLVGGPGSGKTTFGLQFLINGAVQFKEPGLYVSFEESDESLRQAADLFGWNLRALEEKKMIEIMWRNAYEVKSFTTSMQGTLRDLIEHHGVKRIVFDSITCFASSLEQSSPKLRREISELSRRLRSFGVTSLYISEVPETQSLNASNYAVEEFLVDGVVYLHNFLVRDTRQRAIEILKLRKTSHDTFIRPFKITSEGISVFNKDFVFKE